MSFYNESFASSCELSEMKNYNHWDHIVYIWYLSMWHTQKRNIPQFKSEILLLFCDFRILEVGNNSSIFAFICFPVLKYVCMCLCMYAPYFCVTEHMFLQNLSKL